jgi:hypothetical protein
MLTEQMAKIREQIDTLRGDVATRQSAGNPPRGTLPIHSGAMEPGNFSARGGCPICRERVTTPLVSDHCHATGLNRQFICRACNLGLGHFKDNPEALRRAAAYLEHHARRAVEVTREVERREAATV